jgi:acetyltransferase
MNHLFNPDGIAIVGASSNPAKAGYVAIRNMREKAYPGNVYPINPRETEILGYRCFASLKDVEGNIDLLVLIMPSRMIYNVMDELDQRMEARGDVKFLVCAAADYAETKTA